jgi:hypothetical protein
MKSFSILLLLCFALFTAKATTYYSEGSLAPNTEANWNSNRDGTSGSTPGDFTSGDIFVIQNGHSMVTSATWTVSGTNSRVWIENGGTLTASHTFTPSVNFQIDNGGNFIQNIAAVMGTTTFAGTEVFGASSNFTYNFFPTTPTLPTLPGFGNLTINTTTNVTNVRWGNTIAYIQGNLTVSSTGTGAIRHDLTQTNSLIMNIGGDLIINGSSALLTGATGIGTCTLNVTGDVIISAGTLDLANSVDGGVGTLNIAGNYNQSGGTFLSSSATSAVKFTGSNKTFAQSAGTLTNTNINWTVNSGASLTLNNDLPVAASRTATINGTLTCGVNTIVSGSGTFTLASAGTLRTANTDGILSTGFGSIQTAGRGFNTGANYEYNGSSAQVTGNGLPATVSSLTINNAAGVTLSFAVLVTNVLTVTSGTLTTGANLTLNGSTGSAVIDASAALNISGGTTNFNGRSVTFKSNATGTARLAAVTGTLSNAANVTVERFISANSNRAWRLLTPGVNTLATIRANWMEGTNNPDVSTNNIGSGGAGFGTHITGSNGNTNGFDQTLTNAASLYFYNQGTQSWEAVNSTTTGTDIATMNAKRGYLLFVRGDRSNISRINATASSGNTVLRATGTILTGNQTFTVSGTNNNFSLITNPYPSPISWTSVINDADNTGKFAIQYTLWDPNISTRGGYVTVTNGGVNSGGGNATVNIQSGQAFFVRNADGVTTSFSIKESHKSTTNNIDVFRTGVQQEMLRAGLFFTHTDNSRRQADGVVTVYDNNYSAAFDGNDAMQIANWDEDVAIISNNKELSIESRPLADNGDTIFFNMARLREMNYEWEFVAENFNAPGLTAYVQDAFTNTETAISLSGTTVVPFTVTSNAASKAANRFRVVYRTSGVLPVTLTSVKAFQQNDGITVAWNTQSESGMQQYEVEKSANGTSFTKVNTTPAKSGTSNSYNYFDATPINGANYYRIKAISLNGDVKYSTIVVVRLGDKGTTVSVYPNPVKGNTISIALNGLNKGNYTLSVFNQLGQQVLNRVINHNGGNATQTFDLSALAAGVYEMRLSNGTTVFTDKLIKE